MDGSSIKLWLWDDAAQEWVKAPASVVTIRLVAAGLIVAGRHKLHWIKCNPSVANSEWALSDAIIALAAVVLDSYHAGREGHTVNFIPPMQFTTGIYLETFTNMNSMTFGYI